MTGERAAVLMPTGSPVSARQGDLLLINNILLAVLRLNGMKWMLRDGQLTEVTYGPQRLQLHLFSDLARGGHVSLTCTLTGTVSCGGWKGFDSIRSP